MTTTDLISLNKQVVKIVKTIKILDKISWPSNIEVRFFERLAKGKKSNLKFKYRKFDLSEQRKKLVSFGRKLSKSEPTEIYTKSTIDSYISAIDMIYSIGTKRFQEISIKEYGTPAHSLFGSEYSHLETAKKFIKLFEEYEHPFVINDMEKYSALQVKKFLTKDATKVFGEDSPKIILTDSIVSKAAASKSGIRIRKNAIFGKNDFDQLLVHEMMTHTLTAINGSHQKNLPLMQMGAPRTTKTQEGLATFAEIITGSLDLSRLKRISLRVIALDMALNGADFYDLFDYFISHNQTPKESYLSASRIFRGGTAEGGIVFTKDGVYLEGLIRVHSFFRWAFKTKNLDLVHLLFCGRLDINDVFLLKPAYEKRIIHAPKFLPDWYTNTDLLAGKMAFSLILNGIDLNLVDKHFASKL